MSEFDFPILIFIALLIFVFGLFSRLSDHSPITAPMVFVAVGLIVSPFGLNYLRAGITAPLVHGVAKATLVMALETYKKQATYAYSPITPFGLFDKKLVHLLKMLGNPLSFNIMKDPRDQTKN